MPIRKSSRAASSNRKSHGSKLPHPPHPPHPPDPPAPDRAELPDPREFVLALFALAAIAAWLSPVAPEPWPPWLEVAEQVGVEVPEVPAWAGCAPNPLVAAPACATQVEPLAVWPSAAAPERPDDMLTGWPAALPDAETGWVVPAIAGA